MATKPALIWLTGLALYVRNASAAAEAVTFRLSAPGARNVVLTGSFAGWQTRQPLRRAADGTWSIVLDLPPGRYEYVYVVDGSTTLDPGVPSIPDGLGGRNSVVTVAPAP